jgi:TonB family protein
MRLSGTARLELFSAAEIARAAGVGEADVRSVLASGEVVAFRQRFVAPADAVALVRHLARRHNETVFERAPLRLVLERKRRAGLSLAASGFVHALLALLLGAFGLVNWLSANETEEEIPQEVHLVYLMSPGPGGGGGGGGLKMELNPPPAERKAPAPAPPKKISSPVVTVRRPPPPVRSTARLTKPIEPPVITPKPVDRPPVPPPQVVQAPVRAIPANPVDTTGLLASRSTATSQGSGTDGGVGSGAGTGMGSGQGSGIGPGTGGGTGGGPYGPGSGIEPPRVLTEVRPTYTDEARRRAIQGAVSLEVVVTQSGRVGNVRVLRGLGAGLDQKAIDAVRQWRFVPAKRQGAPVDVVVQVSVEFNLR